MARSKSYRDLHIEALKNSQEAAAYLKAILEEYKEGDEQSRQLLLSSIKDVAEAQGLLELEKLG